MYSVGNRTFVDIDIIDIETIISWWFPVSCFRWYLKHRLKIFRSVKLAVMMQFQFLSSRCFISTCTCGNVVHIYTCVCDININDMFYGYTHVFCFCFLSEYFRVYLSKHSKVHSKELYLLAGFETASNRFML